MLHTLTESGHMAWACHGCGDDQMAHISHAEVKHATLVTGAPDPQRISLPPCACGWQMFLKASFTPAELANIGRFDADGNPTNASIEAAQRHIQLARQMISAGKGPTT